MFIACGLVEKKRRYGGGLSGGQNAAELIYKCKVWISELTNGKTNKSPYKGLTEAIQDTKNNDLKCY